MSFFAIVLLGSLPPDEYDEKYFTASSNSWIVFGILSLFLTQLKI